MAQALWSLLADDGQTDRHFWGYSAHHSIRPWPLGAGWAVSGQDGEGALSV